MQKWKSGSFSINKFESLIFLLVTQKSIFHQEETFIKLVRENLSLFIMNLLLFSAIVT